MKYLLILLSLVTFSELALGQGTDTIHADWVRDDIELIHTLEKINKKNPNAMEAFFLQFKGGEQRDTLGFGWDIYSPGKGAGYISVNAQFFHYKGKIVSYQLSSRLPRNKDLQGYYRKQLAKLLPLNSNGFCFYKFHPSAILRPLPYYSSSNRHIPSRLLSFMSPTSGIIYPIGTFSLTSLPKGTVYNDLVTGKLSNHEVITLMYAINPAVRVMAFNYFQHHRNKFSNPGKLDAWMRKAVQEKPYIDAISGCMINPEQVSKLIIDIN